MSEVLVHVMRGEQVESVHRGNIVVVDGSGKVLHALGDPGKVTFWRSAAKPFQVLPMVEAGGIEAFGFTGEEIALMAASHNGEPEHIKVLKGILCKVGYAEDDLECGSASPLHGRTARELLGRGEAFGQVHNPCSGKHGSMLALARLMGVSQKGYSQLSHPVQQKMLEVVANCTGTNPQSLIVGIDGCGVPVFGMPLKNMALAYAALTGSPMHISEQRREALKMIKRAMTEHPFYVAGTGRPDTAIMKATGGRVLAKVGSEGIYCMSTEGLGIAIKVGDGSSRAVGPIAIELLSQLGLLQKYELEGLAKFHSPQIKNHRQDAVGSIKPVFSLMQ